MAAVPTGALAPGPDHQQQPHNGLCMFRKKGTDIALPQTTLVMRPIKQQTDAKYVQRSGFVYNNDCNK
jgi:hypothetical protein